MFLWLSNNYFSAGIWFLKMSVFVPVFASLTGQKWCTLLFHNLNRTKKEKILWNPYLSAGILFFVAKQQKQLLLLDGENKNTNWEHSCFWSKRFCLKCKTIMFQKPLFSAGLLRVFLLHFVTHFSAFWHFLFYVSFLFRISSLCVLVVASCFLISSFLV